MSSTVPLKLPRLGSMVMFTGQVNVNDVTSWPTLVSIWPSPSSEWRSLCHPDHCCNSMSTSWHTSDRFTDKIITYICWIINCRLQYRFLKIQETTNPEFSNINRYLIRSLAQKNPENKTGELSHLNPELDALLNRLKRWRSRLRSRF